MKAMPMFLRCAATFVLLASFAVAQKDPTALLDAAAQTFKQIQSDENKRIPPEVLEKAQCICVVPGTRSAGFVVGSSYKRGILTCRTGAGWSGPAIVRLEGDQALTIGGGEADVVFLMNQRSMDKIMGGKFTFGGDVSATAGPIGRTPDSVPDAKMRSEVLSYSHSRGILSGFSPNGLRLLIDSEGDAALYGRAVGQYKILNGEAQPVVKINYPECPPLCKK
jgi:SH3 domain-containing YSC84-like protein 1